MRPLTPPMPITSSSCLSNTKMNRGHTVFQNDSRLRKKTEIFSTAGGNTKRKQTYSRKDERALLYDAEMAPVGIYPRQRGTWPQKNPYTNGDHSSICDMLEAPCTLWWENG